MLLKDFFTRFKDEKDCVSYFKDVRQAIGITCPKCGHKETSWLKGREEFQCLNCGCRIPLTKGTVMENSHLPMYAWLFTAHLMTSFKQVLSAKEVQHQLDMKEYPPVWLMMMKLRDIMGKREKRYKLTDEMELDISYFPTSSIVGGDIVTKKTPVLVMAESKSVDDMLLEYLNNMTADNINKASHILRKASRKGVKKSVRYIKMFSIPNEQYETIKPLIIENVDSKTKAVTDGGKNLYRLKDLLEEHESHVETEYGAHEVVINELPWVHIITGECRSGIEAIHRNVDVRFIQLYLNEYCWKFNRRFFRDTKLQRYDLFDHLVKIMAKYTSDLRWRDYGTAINNC